MTRNDEIMSGMDPQHQLIYMMGEVKGELRSMRTGLDAAGARQADINLQNSAKFSDVDKTLLDHAEQLAKLGVPKPEPAARPTWPQIIGGVGGIGALVILVLTLFPNFVP